MTQHWNSPLPRSMAYVPTMTVLTAVYLATELGFNARLLDVTGGSPTHEQIASIEWCGRCISGVAVLLAVWGMVILPRAVPDDRTRSAWHPSLLAAALLVSGVISVATAYKGERLLIDRLVDGSSGAQRRTAAQLQAISVAILHGSADVAGIDLTADERRQPAAQTFLSIFPVIALATPDLEARTRRILATAIRATIETRLASPAHVHNTAYLPALDKVRSLYNDRYIAGVESYNQAIRGIPGRQDQAWSQYAASLKERNRNFTPFNVPLSSQRQVAKQVKDKLGVDVPPSWSPSDRDTFNQAITDKIRQQADDAFASQTRTMVGTALPRDLDWPHFLALPAIQRRLRDQLHVPDTVILTGTMTPDQTAQQLYMPMVDQMTNEQVSVLLKPADSFGDGGTEEVKGREAMEALLVKPIALGFSLAGALFHIFKTLRYLLQCGLPRIGWRTKNLAVGLPVVAAVLAVFAMPNPVSMSRGFSALEQHTRDAWGKVGSARYGRFSAGPSRPSRCSTRSTRPCAGRLCSASPTDTSPRTTRSPLSTGTRPPEDVCCDTADADSPEAGRRRHPCKGHRYRPTPGRGRRRPAGLHCADYSLDHPVPTVRARLQRAAAGRHWIAGY